MLPVAKYAAKKLAKKVKKDGIKKTAELVKNNIDTLQKNPLNVEIKYKPKEKTETVSDTMTDSATVTENRSSSRIDSSNAALPNNRAAITTSINTKELQKSIKRAIAKTLIEAGEMLQKNIEKELHDTKPHSAKFGKSKKRNKRPKKKATKKTKKRKSTSLSSFGWKGSLSAETRHKALDKAVKALGVQVVLSKLKVIERLQHKKKTGPICIKDIAHVKSTYKR